jgi:hypothetical protein
MTAAATVVKLECCIAERAITSMMLKQSSQKDETRNADAQGPGLLLRPG